jgi:hypothetical protein
MNKIIEFFKNLFGSGNKVEEIDPDEPVVTQSPAEVKVDEVLNALLSFNIHLRDNPTSQKVVEYTEEVIDLVAELVERVNANQLSEMTPIVNRMPVRYLPALINPFILLSADEKAKNEELLISKLGKLKTELETVKTSIENKDTDAFDKQAEFISAMFTNATDTL